MLDFGNSTAVITGIGIGYELARLFAEHGTWLVLARYPAANQPALCATPNIATPDQAA